MSTIPSFQQRVWNICAKVPRGKVTTYKAIARSLGTKAYRAVGQALNKNRSARVPCHRVIGSDGSLTGFATGLTEKKRLLKLEGIQIRREKINLRQYGWRP